MVSIKRVGKRTSRCSALLKKTVPCKPVTKRSTYFLTNDKVCTKERCARTVKCYRLIIKELNPFQVFLLLVISGGREIPVCLELVFFCNNYRFRLFRKVISLHKQFYVRPGGSKGLPTMSSRLPLIRFYRSAQKGNKLTSV